MHKKLKPYIMIMPVLMLMILFIHGLINGIIQSFGIIPAIGLKDFTLDYYKMIFENKNIILGIKQSIYISLVSSIFAIIIGIVISYVVSTNGLMKRKIFQLFKIPIIVPHMVSALLIINIFSQSGIISRIFYSLGFIENQEMFISLLYDKNGIGIIFAYLWKEIPFVILIVSTIMANIDSSLGEAAINLGASKFKAFFSITLPLCKSTIATSFIIIFAYSFGAYEIPYLLGPTSPKALPVMAYVEYIHPSLLNRPYAMVLNSIMVIISIILTYIYYKIIQRNIVKAQGGQ